MTNQVSSLTVRLVDDASKPARTVGQALEEAARKAKDIAKAMSETGATDRFVSSLSRLKLSARDVEAVTKSWLDYSVSARLASAASEWTAAQAAGVRRWESTTIAALREVQREQARFVASSKKMAATTEHGESPMCSHRGALGAATQAAAAAASAHSVLDAIREAIVAGAERQHVKVTQANAGMSPREVRASEAGAILAARGAPNMSVSQIMELHKEARSAVQNPREALEMLPMLAKAASVLKGMGVENANIADIVKAGESLGLMNSPARFKHYLEGQIKAMSVMGKTITTEQIYEAAKYSKAAGATLSDRFLNVVLPSVIQELHGSSAGEALAKLSSTFRGGLQHRHLPVQQLESIGMLQDPSKIRRSKTGQIMGYAGKLVGDQFLANDPDKFAAVLDAHMEAAGIKSLEDKTAFIQQVLPGTAGNLIRILIQQRKTLEQHARLYDQAPGLDKAAENQRADPTAAVGNFKSALNDLLSALSSPLMKTAGLSISSLAGSIRSLSEAAKAHPNWAVAAGGTAAAGGLAASGYLARLALGGFGLRGSAAALNVSAAELSAAAARLGVGGSLPNAVKAAAPAAGGILGFLSGLALPTAAAAGATYVMRHFAQRMPTPQEQEDSSNAGLELPGFEGGLPESARGAPPARASAKSPFGDLSGVRLEAETTKTAIDALNTSVTPKIDASGFAAAQAAAEKLLATLMSIGSAARGAQSAAAGISVPSLGVARRSSFSPAGDPGR